MASNDYIPSKDSDLLAFANTFSAFITSTPTAVGLVAQDATELSALVSDFDAANSDNVNTTAASQAARQTKDIKRAALVARLRQLAKRIQAFPGTSDTERSSLGLTIPDKIPTAVGAPSSQPQLFIDTSQRLRHSITFKDVLTPNSKAKPKGALGCEIYQHIGANPPADIAMWEGRRTATNQPYEWDIAPAYAGMQAHYCGRWVTRTGQVGAWGDIVTATVVA